MHVPTRITTLIVGLLALLGCSSLDFAYFFANDLLEDQAKTYLDLSTEQEERLAQQTAALIAWHRTNMLPKYGLFLRAQAEIAEAGGWTRPQLRTAMGQFRTLMKQTVEGASPFIAEVISEHTNPQKLAHLEAQMAENLAERRAEEVAKTPQEAIEEWIKRGIDRISRLTGPLTQAQIDIIRAYTENGSGNAMRWLKNREYRQKALVAFLRTQPEKTKITTFVSRIVLRAYEVIDPDYRQISDARWALREAMYFNILTALNDEQRKELITNLRGYAADMAELART